MAYLSKDQCETIIRPFLNAGLSASSICSKMPQFLWRESKLLKLGSPLASSSPAITRGQQKPTVSSKLQLSGKLTSKLDTSPTPMHGMLLYTP